MLQIYNSPSVQVREGGSTHDVPYSAELSAADLLAKVIGFIHRQFPVILSVVLLTIGLAAVYIFTTPPLYSAEARMMFDTGKVQLFEHSILGQDPVNSAMMDSQLEILKSENFALSVIENLHLTEYPEFAEFHGGLIGNLVSNLFKSNKNETKSELEVTRRVMRAFEDRLTVSRVGMAYVIEIGFKSIDPVGAAQIANAVADTFIADQVEAKYHTIRNTAAWLQDRLNELRGQASAAERAVVEYKTKYSIVDSGGRLTNEQQLTELNTALVKARADTVEAQARLDRLSQILRSDDFNPEATELAAVTDTLHSDIISKLRQQYLELAQREALFSNRLGANHLAVVNLRSQMREIRRSILDQMKQIAAAYNSDYDIAKVREDSLEKSVAATITGSQATNKAQIDLRQLESAAQTYRALYDNFQQRYMDSVQQQSLPMTEARIITRASRPSAKSSPKSLLILAAATMGGLVLGLGLAMLREIFDRAFRTDKQVEAQLKTECVSLVPMIKPGAKAAPVGTRAAADLAASRIIAPNAGLLRYVIDSPLSPFAESIRAIKVNVDADGAARSNKVVGITSSLPNEGKSTIAASLAQLSAHGGARVILVDCDLRKPSLSQELVPNATPGLIDVITEHGQSRRGNLVRSIYPAFLSAGGREIASDPHQ